MFLPHAVKEFPWITFKVKGDGPALIGLFTNKTDDFKNADFFEILLGEPGMANISSIRNSLTGTVTRSLEFNETILDGDKFLPFWVQVSKNGVLWGRGTVLEHGIIAKHRDATLSDTNFVAFGSLNSTLEFKYYNGRYII